MECNVSQRDAKKNAQGAKKKEERANCEMENSEPRFVDLRSSTLGLKGSLF